MYNKDYLQRFECTNCGYVHTKPIRWTSMNSELWCPKCNSLAFGLIKRTIVKKESNNDVFN